MGRPSEFTPERAEIICARLAEGESLRTICKDDGMPAMGTVMRWLPIQPAFQEQYARAREQQADYYAAQIVDIADDSENDYTETEDGAKPNPEMVNRARLRVDARKWYASKLAPKKYGDKLELAGDQERPLTVQVLRLTDANNPATE